MFGGDYVSVVYFIESIRLFVSSLGGAKWRDVLVGCGRAWEGREAGSGWPIW